MIGYKGNPFGYNPIDVDKEKDKVKQFASYAPAAPVETYQSRPVQDDTLRPANFAPAPQIGEDLGTPYTDTIPKQAMQTYAPEVDDPSDNFKGISKADEAKLMELSNDNFYKAQDLYPQLLTYKNDKMFLKDRQGISQDLAMKAAQEKNPRMKAAMMHSVKMANLADHIRTEAMNSGSLGVADKSDDEIINDLRSNSPLGEQGSLDALSEYLSGKSDTESTSNKLFNGIVPEPQEMDLGFFGNSAQDIKDRFKGFYDYVGDGKLTDFLPGGERDIKRTLLRAGGALAGAANDVMGNAVEGLIKRFGYEESIANVIKKITDTEIGQIGLQAIEKGTEAFGKFEEVHPVYAQDIKDAWQIAQFAPVPGLAGTEIGQKVINGVNDAVGAVVKAPLRGFAKILPDAEKVIQKGNRLTKGEQTKFFDMVGKSQGEWMNERGIDSFGYKTIDKLSELFMKSKNEADIGLEAIQGTFKDKNLSLMADDAARFSHATLDPEASNIAVLALKANNEGLSMQEANTVKRYFERNNKLAYGKDMTAGEKSVRATNIDNAVREWQFKLAEDKGFGNLREINKETQASKFILDKLTKAVEGKIGNNNFTLTDWIASAGMSVDPSYLSLVAGKKLVESSRFKTNYVKLINKLNGHTNIGEKIADLEAIKNARSVSDLDNVLNNNTITDNLPLQEQNW